MTPELGHVTGTYSVNLTTENPTYESAIDLEVIQVNVESCVITDFSIDSGAAIDAISYIIEGE